MLVHQKYSYKEQTIELCKIILGKNDELGHLIDKNYITLIEADLIRRYLVKLILW